MQFGLTEKYTEQKGRRIPVYLDRMHDDFKKLHHITLPMNPAVLPAVNRYLKLHGTTIKPMPRTIITDRKIQGYRGDLIPIRIYEPESIGKKCPCLVYFHGGAFVIHAATYHWKLANLYALRTPCKVVFVDYRLAPQYPFPVGLEDCYSTLQWVYHHAESLGIDRTRIAVGGDSAGGNLAAAVTQLARDRREISPCFQMLIYPAVDARMQTASMREFQDTPMWNAKLNRKMWEIYLPAPVSNRGYASPMEAEFLANLPDAYIEVAELDCLRDEGINYGKALEQAGSRVAIYQSKGTIHGFEMVMQSTIVKACVAERIAALRAAFGVGQNNFVKEER